MLRKKRAAGRGHAKASGDWKVFESSGGFRLPNGSVVSPDASLVRLDR